MWRTTRSVRESFVCVVGFDKSRVNTASNVSYACVFKHCHVNRFAVPPHWEVTPDAPVLTTDSGVVPTKKLPMQVLLNIGALQHLIVKHYRVKKSQDG
jgi:hypothetical protein